MIGRKHVNQVNFHSLIALSSDTIEAVINNRNLSPPKYGPRPGFLSSYDPVMPILAGTSPRECKPTGLLVLVS